MNSMSVTLKIDQILRDICYQLCAQWQLNEDVCKWIKDADFR